MMDQDGRYDDNGHAPDDDFRPSFPSRRESNVADDDGHYDSKSQVYHIMFISFVAVVFFCFVLVFEDRKMLRWFDFSVCVYGGLLRVCAFASGSRYLLVAYAIGCAIKSFIVDVCYF